MTKKKLQPQAQEQPTVRVRVVHPVSVSGLGLLDPGEHEVAAEIAELLIARGFAEPVEAPKDGGE